MRGKANPAAHSGVAASCGVGRGAAAGARAAARPLGLCFERQGKFCCACRRRDTRRSGTRRCGRRASCGGDLEAQLPRCKARAAEAARTAKAAQVGILKDLFGFVLGQGCWNAARRMPFRRLPRLLNLHGQL